MDHSSLQRHPCTVFMIAEFVTVAGVVAGVVVATHASFFTNARDWVAVLSKAYVRSVAFASCENSVHSCVPVSWIAMPHFSPSSKHIDRQRTGVLPNPRELSATRSSPVKLARSIKNCTTPSAVPGSKHPVASPCVVVVVLVVSVPVYFVVLTVFLLASLAAGKCVCRLACALLHSCVFHISCYKYMLAQCERGEGRRRRCKERGEEEV